MKKMLVVLVACIAILAGCSKTNSGKGKVLIGLSVSTQNNPFFVTLTDGAKAEAAAQNCELSVVDAGDDVVKQVSDIEDLISKK